MTTVFELADKASAFKNKLSLWKRKVSMGILDMFPMLSGYLEETESDTLLSVGARSLIITSKQI